MSDWTPLTLIQWTASFFEKKGIPSPRLDAELLLAHVLKCKRLDLYMQFEKIISEQDRTQYRTLVERRAAREPLQYIMGETEFWGLKIQVTPDVLIPRPETELLVEEVIKILIPPLDLKVGEEGIADVDLSPRLKKEEPPHILEIGTGSGCISIALAKNVPAAKIIATDISASALKIAQKNTESHQLQEHISFIEADIAPWKDFASTHQTFDVIVSNPPYIPEAEINALQTEVSQYEPRGALSGGFSGLELVEKIHQESITFLKPNGFLLMEIGEGQAKTLQDKYQGHPLLKWTKSIRDYQHIERIVVFQKGIA